MINYFSLLLPILLIYMAKYYTIKHDKEILEREYYNLAKRYRDKLTETRENNG